MCFLAESGTTRNVNGLSTSFTRILKQKYVKLLVHNYKAVNMIMNALSPLTGIASAVTKSLTLIFVSWSEVEEEMTGFFGTSADINNVPLTAMAKAIANNKHERAYLIDMLRLDK